MANSKAKVTLKLFIDTKGKRVVFAEAGKDSVDFLFNILHLPVGTVVRLLKKQAMLGSLDNLYESVENLNETYLLPTKSKQSVLNPIALTSNSSDTTPVLLLDNFSTTVTKPFYVCQNHTRSSLAHQYVISEISYTECPQCKGSMSSKLAAAERGFVKEVGTYMVTDDLVVTPTSCSTLLNKFNIKEISALEERIVDLGMPEGLKLLKASLHSKTVLTSVFLEGTVESSRKPNLI